MNDAVVAIMIAFDTDIKRISTLFELKQIEITYLGRKGKVNDLFTELKSLSSHERKEFGPQLNTLKTHIDSEIQKLQKKLTSSKNTSLRQSIDVTIPGTAYPVGQLHPTTAVIRKLNSFFRYYGYSVYEGPEIETNEYNFEKLNLPLDHPARELADTLYIKEPEYLLRTHTSSVEARAMTSEELPIRIVVPGKVYRNETSNVTNNAMFYHYEGLVVDKGMSMANLKATLLTFISYLFGEKTKTRVRCKYYPQVEPGMGVDIECAFCNGKTCKVCKYRGWVEVLGAGMVHPHILKSCGIDPSIWTGFAFGIGLDRLVMMTYHIRDIRSLYSGKLVVTPHI